MSSTVIYFSTGGEASDARLRLLAEQGHQVLRSGDAEQLVRFAKMEGVVGVLVEAGPEGATEELRGLVRRLRETPETAAAPIIAVFGTPEGWGDLNELAEAGVTGVHLDGMPERFLLGALGASRSLRELEGYRQAGADVRALAEETRQLIHDLSQPLAALQGRLQVMSAKTPEGDAMREPVELMVKLVLEVSARLRDLQELQRKHLG